MIQKLKHTFTIKRGLIGLVILLILMPVCFIGYTFYINLSQGVANEELDEEYAKRVSELQLEVSMKDPFNLRGNSTDRTRVEFQVSYDNQKLSKTKLIKNMHLMTHQKISARSKWGAIPMTPENIQASSEYLEMLKKEHAISNHYYKELKAMLNHWTAGNFKQTNVEQDKLLRMIQANRGFSNGLATDAEEELFILNNYGPKFLRTMDQATFTTFESSN